MSPELGYLALRLEGPLQAWGFESQFSRRNTGLLPTKSAILGMCCAALGLPRGSEVEVALLVRCTQTRLLAVAIPRSIDHGEKTWKLSPRRITDYHTVQNTKIASGGIKDTHLTYRQYLCDSAFAAVLAGDRALIDELGAALYNPKWGIWLGRKACIPTTPVFVGVFTTEKDALREMIGDEALEFFAHQREVDRFEDGTDSLPDQPVCFAAPNGIRRFLPRRVKLVEGKHGQSE